MSFIYQVVMGDGLIHGVSNVIVWIGIAFVGMMVGSFMARSS